MLRALKISLFVVLASVSAYFGSYFLLVRPGLADAHNGVWSRVVQYRFEAEPGLFDPATFYGLAHSLDRDFLRPSLWAVPLILIAPD